MLPIHTTRLAHLILLNFIILIVFGEYFKFLSSYLRNFVQPTGLFLVQIFYSVLCSGTS